ncbi:hypothetical protein BDN72DRAFT_883390 [Pluteus cervinus]|uniref:Uncharacterized protein n=1 Tax=Pluteus cervinus TaxID=181527 RepID=A0ACD3A5T7_9AGAR|nr:hypothetical protein BDN72DRAFT_883390 [Pluteus cervinus]
MSNIQSSSLSDLPSFVLAALIEPRELREIIHRPHPHFDQPTVLGDAKLTLLQYPSTTTKLSFGGDSSTCPVTPPQPFNTSISIRVQTNPPPVSKPIRAPNPHCLATRLYSTFCSGSRTTWFDGGHPGTGEDESSKKPRYITPNLTTYTCPTMSESSNFYDALIATPNYLMKGDNTPPVSINDEMQLRSSNLKHAAFKFSRFKLKDVLWFRQRCVIGLQRLSGHFSVPICGSVTVQQWLKQGPRK